MLGAEFSVPVFKTQEEADAYADALRDTAVGSTRGVARGLGIVDLFAGVPWLAKTEYSQQALDSMLAQQERLDPEEYKRAQKEGRMTWIERQRATSLGLLGDKESREKINKRINASESKTYDEAIKNFLDTTFPFETNENTQLAENAAFWTTLGVDGAFLLKAVVQAAPKGYAFVRNAIKNIGKNMDEADQAVMKAEMETGVSETPLLPKPEMPWGEEIYKMEDKIEQIYELENRMYDLINLLKQEGTTMSKAKRQKLMRAITKTDYEIRKLNVDEADQAVKKTQKVFSEKTVDKPVPLLTDQRVDKVDEILKRMEKRNKKMAVEADKEAAKIKKEYADMGIEEFTENNKQFVTKPDGMSDEEALKKATEMFKRQTAARESVRKKWANSDTAKDDVAEYNRELKYWKDRRKKQSADFQPSDKLNKALFEDYPEIWTPQKREALAERFINNPEYRTLQKELKEAKRSVDERFRAGEIGEAEFHKQTVLLTDKTNKKTEKLLLDQIKSEAEFIISSDPLKIYEDIVLKKGDYKDITRHLKGGSVQNSVDYALDQWS
tara:strand:- start:254 stop:1915 length:1662 start_codon:yes stop_codon:yes gene_type:complete